MLAYFAIGYPLLGKLSAARGWYVDVSTSLDRAIPFAPVFVFGYALVFLSLLLVYLLTDDRRRWSRAVWTYAVATTVAYACFALLPVRMTLRPDLEGLAGISVAATRLYYSVDAPYNCFPSLHITYAVLAPLLTWRSRPTARWILLAMALVVIPSVLLVKQHYVADAAAGLVNAALCWWLVGRWQSRRAAG